MITRFPFRKAAPTIVLAGLVLGLVGLQTVALPAMAQVTTAQNAIPNLEDIQAIQTAEALKQWLKL